MPYRDFKGLWRVTASNAEECPENSIVTFDRTDDGKVTILCVKDPSFAYGEGTGSYKPDDTIEVTLNGEVYAIKLIPGNPPQIMFDRKGSGQVTGSWTAEDYVPGPPPEPSGQ